MMIPVSKPPLSGSMLGLIGFVGPATALFVLFLVLPFCLAVLFSFSNAKLIQSNELKWVGLENYARMFEVTFIEVDTLESSKDSALSHARLWRSAKRAAGDDLKGFQFLGSATLLGERYLVGARDPIFLKAIGNTFGFVVMVVPMQCLLAFAMALMVNVNLRGKTALRTVFFSPVVTSMVVVSAIWALVYNTDAGVLNELIVKVTGKPESRVDWLGDPSTAMLAIAIMSAWQGAGFQMLIFLAGLQGVSKDQYEAAHVDGASKLQMLWYITIPNLKRTIAFVVISTSIMAFGLFTQVDVLTAGGPKDSTTTIIHRAVEVGFREQEISYGSALTLFFFLFVLTLSLLQKKFLKRLDI